MATNSLNHVLYKLRKERDWSQKRLAEELGVGQVLISCWERGTRNPSLEKAEQIADIFNVDMDYLYGRTDIRKRSHYDNDGTEYVPKKFELSPMERDIIETFRKADEMHQTIVLASLGIESKWQKNDSKQNLG